MNDHPTFEQLSASVDDVDGRTGAVAAHIARCGECAQQSSAIRALKSGARALPKEMLPPADLLAGIRGEIALQERARTSRLSPRRYQLAAAAVLIAALSSLATVSLMRNRSAAPVSTAEHAGAAKSNPAAMLPAQLASAETRYVESVASLQRTLAERRDSLAPSTVALVEKSLRTADSAIAEAREALANDPSNHALVQLFASNYERKIDLLKRATELTPRT